MYYTALCPDMPCGCFVVLDSGSTEVKSSAWVLHEGGHRCIYCVGMTLSLYASHSIVIAEIYWRRFCISSCVLFILSTYFPRTYLHVIGTEQQMPGPGLRAVPAASHASSTGCCFCQREFLRTMM